MRKESNIFPHFCQQVDLKMNRPYKKNLKNKRKKKNIKGMNYLFSFMHCHNHKNKTRKSRFCF